MYHHKIYYDYSVLLTWVHCSVIKKENIPPLHIDSLNNYDIRINYPHSYLNIVFQMTVGSIVQSEVVAEMNCSLWQL